MTFCVPCFENTLSPRLFFTKNLQGDILNIYNEAGVKVASYTYDAWGNHTVTNHTSANIGNINPFRYRGYYYDVETNFYYLNSRYYDPQVKRFISADSISYLGANGDLQAYNLYAYCSNNPVMYVDPNGMWTISIGGNANVTFIVGISVSFGFSFDDNGNVAIQLSYGGNGGVVDAGIGVYLGGTNADTVSDLNGPSMNFGATGGAGWYGGMDLIDLNDGDDEFNGGQILVGYGVGVDIHGGISQTETICQGTWSGIGGWFKEKWEWISGLFD